MTSTGWDIRLNDVYIKPPLDFSISRYNLTKDGRTTSGLMTMDLVAKKRKFFFKYKILAGDHLTTILNIIDTDQMFFNIKYFDEATLTEKSATVYVGEIKADRFRTGSRWYWTDVTFNLIER